jgi:hypothetical protein
VTALFELGRQDFLAGAIAAASDTLRVALLNLSTGAAGAKSISGATNATPIVVTTTSAHGFANGDVVYIDGVAGNVATNGIWTISSASGSNFTLVDPVTGAQPVVGSGAYTSGGVAVNLGPSISFWSSYSALLVGTAGALASVTTTQGVLDASDQTYTNVSGSQVQAIGIYKDTGTAGTSRMIALIAGKFVVTCDTQAASSATTIAVEPLKAGIPSGTTLVFSNGASATTSAAANAGDRSLTVSALVATVSAGSRALAPATGSGLPVTPNGGNITIQWDNGPNKIFKL